MDGFNLALKRGTGIATYGRTLTHSLREMGYQIDVIYGMNISNRTTPDLREIIFFDSLDEEHTAKLPKVFSLNWMLAKQAEMFGLKAVEVPITGRVESREYCLQMPVYDRILNVPSLFRHAAKYFERTKRFLTISVSDPPAIMHWTYPLPIRVAGIKNVYTVHDLVPLRLPYATLDDKGLYYRLIRKICKDADLVCTVSEASRHDIISFFPDSETKIFNTYQTLIKGREGNRNPKSDDGSLDEFGLSAGGYFLFFGSLEPKKNVGRMIEAFLTSPTKRVLVIVGARSWKAEDELRRIRGTEASGRIRHLEYLPTLALKKLVYGARAVLFASLTEGFGLPVLEALSSGTPVLTSREGALPEVAGNAAVYVDAYNTVSITDGIMKLDRDDALCATLRVTGPEQAEKFSPRSYQHKLVDMYRIVLSK